MTGLTVGKGYSLGVILCGLAFAALTTYAAMGRYLPGEKDLLAYVTGHRMPILNQPAQIISLLGSINVILPLWMGFTLVLLVRRQRASVWRFLPVPLGYPLYALVKSLVARPGSTPTTVPWIYDLSLGYVVEGLLRRQLQELPPQGVSVPVVPQPVTTQAVEQVMERGYVSGHALVAMIFYGTVAWWMWTHLAPGTLRRAATAACVALGFLVGIVRIYMGLHYPSDVLGAWLLAILFIAGIRVFSQTIERRILLWQKQNAAAVG